MAGGSLNGVVIDEVTKETIIGANVYVTGTQKATATDIDGFYAINNIPPGKYTISVTYIGYENANINDVEIKPGEKLTLNIVISTNTKLLETVTVTESKKTNTVASVLLEVKQARQVVSGVSNQQILRSQDNNAAQVAARIPGVTVHDGKFIMIRGLSERYNSVLINNVAAPSTEIDKRTFAFDLIPSSALDRVLINKSGAAEFSGDYAGGVIRMYTLDEVEDNFTKLSIGMGYRTGTTFEPYVQTKGSATDFLGFDSGYRQLPSNFPSTRSLQSDPRNGNIRYNAAQSLENNFQPLESTASPDHSLGLSFGRILKNGNNRFTTFNSINYSTSYQHFNREFNRYFALTDPSKPIDLRFRFIDGLYEKQNRVSIMSNWKLKIGNSRFSFKNLFNQIGENETTIRKGNDFIQRPNQELANYMFGYRSRSIYTGQLEGIHDINNSVQLQWIAGGSFLKEIEPDLRRFRTFRSLAQKDQNYTIIDPPSSNLFDTGRYFGDLSEFSVNHAANLSISSIPIGSKPGIVKFGYSGDYRDRDFDSRYMSYLYPGFFNANVGNSLKQLPLNQIFSHENIKTKDGWVLEEGTRGIDSYTASSLTFAAYSSMDASFGKLDITTGLRGEYNIQKMQSLGDNALVNVDNPTFHLLPFFNSAYNLSDKSLMRLAYSMTVNRPEFREIAPFAYYDYKYDATKIGEPGLESARIHNLDIRFETYPRVGETFSFGAFYKYFNNPIEAKTIITTELPTFSYINANKAKNFGLELELRKSLRGITNSAFLDNFSVNANVSAIFSEVDLGETAAIVQDQIRPLQGQSPYIINLVLNYEEPKTNLIGAISFNRFGNRIFSVGDRNFPTIYELSRSSLDATISKKFGSFTYKLGVQNLLNTPYRLFEDSDRDEKININNGDYPVQVYSRGQLINLSVSFDLK
jgi:outer membrane receptor for ferrienterochelin and colicin